MPQQSPSITRRFSTHRADDTMAIGESLAREFAPGDLVTLQGELGAGKTTLVQGIARGLGVLETATSPTYVLIIEHEGEIPLLHLDAYRLENRTEKSLSYEALCDAGVLDFLERRDAVKVVEWPQRIASVLPTADFEIHITDGATENERNIEVIHH